MHDLIPGAYVELQPGDRVRFRDTSQPCHRPGLHIVRAVKFPAFGAAALRPYGMHQQVFLIGRASHRRRFTAGQFYACDFTLVRREP